MRILPLALVLLVLSLPASADQCMTEGNFAAKGGVLVHKGGNKLYQDTFLRSIPATFSDCDRIACYGDIELGGTISKEGAIRDLKIIRNAYGAGGVANPERAEILRRWFSTAKYEPPRLGNRSVCVQKRWGFSFKISG